MPPKPATVPRDADISTSPEDGESPEQSSSSFAGPMWMVFAAASFAAMTGVVRHVSDELHPLEIVFFRSFFGLLFMMPWLIRNGFAEFRRDLLELYLVRAVLGVVAMSAWFYAINMIPITQATALNFTWPLFGTVFAAVVLKEYVPFGRGLGALLGFAGVIVIIRPEIGGLSGGAVVALIAAAAIAASAIVIKILARSQSTNGVIAYSHVLLMPMTLAPALFVWRTPSLSTLLWLFLLGGLATLAHVGVTRALRRADASRVLPFDFMRLPFVAIIGYAAFGETLDVWTLAGALIIAVATVYVGRSNSTPAAEKPV